MTWVVDTCVLIDVFRGDKQFSEMSSMALQSKLDDVLTIAPITYVELAPEFNGDVAAQDAFLDAIWNSPARECRSAYRLNWEFFWARGDAPTEVNSYYCRKDIGFRLMVTGSLQD